MHADLWGKPLDEFSELETFLTEKLKPIILTDTYDWVFETLTHIIRHKSCPNGLVKAINEALKKNQAAWVVSGEDDNTFYPVSSDYEPEIYEQVSMAIKANDLHGAGRHLNKSAELYNKGDFNGSVRESIHAVESVARKIAKEKTLPLALKQLQASGVEIHPALLKGFDNIYGYTSDAQGVRHAYIDESINVDEADAQFMLSACAAFVTYLASHANKVGIRYN